jgi:ankyrin repeat protein
MKLQTICLSLGFTIISAPIMGMEFAESKKDAAALINADLHIAIATQNGDEVKELIEMKNADVNSRDDNGSSPLLSAINKGSWDIAGYILERTDVNVNLADKQGRTPLYAAARQCSLDTVKKLVEKGADINHKTKDGLSAWDIALAKKAIAPDAATKAKYDDIILALDRKK